MQRSHKVPLVLLGLLLVGLFSLVRPSAQTAGTVASPTPYPVGVAPILTPIPPQDDPDQPGISREERFRRARALITSQQQMTAAYQERVRNGEVVFTPIPPPPRGRSTAFPPKPSPASGGAGTSGTLAKTTDTAHSGLDVSKEASPPHATLYLDPASRTIASGEQFATQIRLLNSQHLAMDALHIALSYPAKNIRPVAVHQNALVRNLKRDPKIAIAEEGGVLRYDAVLSKTLDGIDIPLLTIVWEGLTPGEGLWILPTGDRDRSAIYWGGQSITASITGLNNTLTGARVSVRAGASDVPQGNKFLTPTLESMQPLLIGLPDQNRLRKPQLWLGQPAAGTPVRAGEWIAIDVGVENPDHMAFDEVKLAGSYDPAVVKLADSDKENWINTGENILDGPFHQEWPWDLHFANRIDARRGVFFYHMAMSQYREQPSSVIARVFAQARQDTVAPLIRWSYDPAANFDQPTTGIYLLGENVLLRGTDLAQKSTLGQTVEGQLPGYPHTHKADPSLYRSAPKMQSGDAPDLVPQPAPAAPAAVPDESESNASGEQPVNQ